MAVGFLEKSARFGDIPMQILEVLESSLFVEGISRFLLLDVLVLNGGLPVFLGPSLVLDLKLDVAALGPSIGHAGDVLPVVLLPNVVLAFNLFYEYLIFYYLFLEVVLVTLTALRDFQDVLLLHDHPQLPLDVPHQVLLLQPPLALEVNGLNQRFALQHRQFSATFGFLGHPPRRQPVYLGQFELPGFYLLSLDKRVPKFCRLTCIF